MPFSASINNYGEIISSMGFTFSEKKDDLDVYVKNGVTVSANSSGVARIPIDTDIELTPADILCINISKEDYLIDLNDERQKDVLRRISANLSSSMLKNNIPSPKKNICIELKNVTSSEMRLSGNDYIPVLRNISFTVLEHMAFGIGSFKRDELVILGGIIANMREYYNGYAKLGKKGTQREKGIELSHIFFFDSPYMLDSDMTVSELFSIVSMSSGKEDDTPVKLLNVIAQCVPPDTIVNSLDLNKKMIILLAIAGMCCEGRVIAGFADFTFLQNEIYVIADVAEIIKKNCTPVFLTMQPKLIGMVCDETAYIKNGSVCYSGSVTRLTSEWDKTICSVKCIDTDKAVSFISERNPVIKCEISNGVIYLTNSGKKWIPESDILTLLAESGAGIEAVKFNKGRVENSFEELMNDESVE